MGGLSTFFLFVAVSPQEKNYNYENYTATDTRTDVKQLTLPKLEERLLVEETETYYQPRSIHFPAIDWRVLVQPTPQESIFLIFQIALDVKAHDTKKTGLDRVEKFVGASVKKYLAIVTPVRVPPMITVSRDYLTDAVLARSFSLPDQ